jgi:hypothetical protein
LLAICNWIQTEWFKLYCEYTYEKKEKTNISGDNTACSGWQWISNNTITISAGLNYLFVVSLSYHCFILAWLCFKLPCSISHALVNLCIKYSVFIIIFLVAKNTTASVQIAYAKYVKLFSSFYFWLWILICSRYFYTFFGHKILHII